jgi:hypothetical protein
MGFFQHGSDDCPDIGLIVDNQDAFGCHVSFFILTTFIESAIRKAGSDHCNRSKICGGFHPPQI